MGTFVAIDFETSHPKRDSACAVALVRVEGEKIVERAYRLIRPTRTPFMFTEIHGLRWRDVARAPEFPEVWGELAPMLEGASYFVAHNAPFDRSVLEASCQSAGLTAPPLPFLCTMQLARRVWAPPSAKLNEVCALLDIPLRHHNALSDAEACAQILLRARKERPGIA